VQSHAIFVTACFVCRDLIGVNNLEQFPDTVKNLSSQQFMKTKWRIKNIAESGNPNAHIHIQNQGLGATKSYKNAG